MHEAHAVVIGIASYPKISKLPTVVVNDASMVYKVLTDPDYCGYPPENVRLLVDEQATRQEVLESLEQLAARTTPDSTMLLYFSGHAGYLGPKRGGPVYMLTVDADLSDVANTAITSDEVVAALRQIPARNTAVVLDSCYAGSFLDSLQGLANEVILASSGASELSYVLPGRPTSLFTSHLLDGLRGGCEGSDGFIRILDLFKYIQPRVEAEKLDGRRSQHPVLTGSMDANFAIGLRLGGKPSVKARKSKPAAGRPAEPAFWLITTDESDLRLLKGAPDTRAVELKIPASTRELATARKVRADDLMMIGQEDNPDRAIAALARVADPPQPDGRGGNAGDRAARMAVLSPSHSCAARCPARSAARNRRGAVQTRIGPGVVRHPRADSLPPA